MRKLLKIFSIFIVILINNCSKNYSNTGYSYKIRTKECNRCSGTGKIACNYCLKSRPEKCPLCHKTYARRCPSCEGTGKVNDCSDDEKAYSSDSSDN